MPPIPAPAKGPCETCAVRQQQGGCPAFVALDQELYRKPTYRRTPALSPLDASLNELSDAWFDAIRQLVSAGRLSRRHVGHAVSALFDLAASGVYANALLHDDGRLVTDDGTARQEFLLCGTDAVFPYTWMCPSCVAAGVARKLAYLPTAKGPKLLRDSSDRWQLFAEVDRLAKPNARAIGDAGIAIVKAILRSLMGAKGDTVRLREGGGKGGGFDLTITTAEQLLLIEVKAKPLIAYPLTVHDVRAHDDGHEWSQMLGAVADKRLTLFLGATGNRLELSNELTETWPLPSLTDAVTDPDQAYAILFNWYRHYAAYRRLFGKGEPDRLRWHRFGCGNFEADIGGLRVEHRVANTKELPGLDRTDDIKKGTTQALLFSRYKFLCQRDAIRSVLLGNLYAETHGADYVDPLARIRIRDADAHGPPVERWLYDAFIGFSRDRINAPEIAELLSAQQLLG